MAIKTTFSFNDPDDWDSQHPTYGLRPFSQRGNNFRGSRGTVPGSRVTIDPDQQSMYGEPGAVGNRPLYQEGRNTVPGSKATVSPTQQRFVQPGTVSNRPLNGAGRSKLPGSRLTVDPNQQYFGGPGAVGGKPLYNW